MLAHLREPSSGWEASSEGLVIIVRNRRGKKEPPLRTVDEGLGGCSRAELPGRVSEETKGVFEV